MNKVAQKIAGGLIVSCQALPHEPLHSPQIMARMAVAAVGGGAKGIRANSVSDIQAIRQAVDLPIIGIIKQDYPGSDIRITPTLKEVDALAASGCEIIALDATGRKRPGGMTLEELFARIRSRYPQKLFMADCSCYEEGIRAARMGFDFIGTTLCGYTDDTAQQKLPNLGLIRDLCADCGKPVIAEGGIWTPEQYRDAMACGALAAVVGTAITRPMEITRRFVDSWKDGQE